VLTGDSFHIAAVEPDLCAQHALRFIDEVSARNAGAAAVPAARDAMVPT